MSGGWAAAPSAPGVRRNGRGSRPAVLDSSSSTRRFGGSGSGGLGWAAGTCGCGAVGRAATGCGAASMRGGGPGCGATRGVTIGGGVGDATRDGSGALQFLHSFRMSEFTVWQWLQRTSLASMRDPSKEKSAFLRAVQAKRCPTARGQRRRPRAARGLPFRCSRIPFLPPPAIPVLPCLEQLAKVDSLEQWAPTDQSE